MAAAKSAKANNAKTSNAKTGIAKSKPAKTLLTPLMQAFLANALPGENEGFDDAACEQAAKFTLSLAALRKPGKAAIAIDSFVDGGGRLAMRVAICNDDMPFLVDSVSGAIASAGLKVQRLIHPVLAVKRDQAGAIVSISTQRGEREHRESFIYLESSRVDAKERRALETSLAAVLNEVRCAVQDWPKMLSAIAADVTAITDEKGADLLRWFGAGNMTILGHETLIRDGNRTQRLGIVRANDLPLLSGASAELAFRWFEKGGAAPLILKANRMSRVHRNTLLDMLLVPKCSGKKIEGLAITAGLWTSEALASKPENIPMLRDHMTGLMNKFGFDPAGHAGKAMAHVLTNLPHDLLVSLTPDDLERLALTAMSLNDRPRPKLLAMRSPLGRHLFVIVWLPRDEVSTAIRHAISQMLVHDAKANLLGWSIVLEDSGLATLRFTLDLPDRTSKINEAALDKKLQLMVRGWEPAVEAALVNAMDEKRAAAIMVRYAAAFPANYRSVYSAEEAALDMQGLVAMERDHSRITRFYRHGNGSDANGGNALGLKVYNRGGAMPLSDIVPALENFGFDVIEESPTALNGEVPAYIHDFKLTLRGNDNAQIVMERADILQSALSAVLDGDAENDAFNQLIVVAQIEPQAAVWLRAWFRYLRQTGLTYGLLNVVEALGKNPKITRAIIALFAVLHDPGITGNRQKEAERLINAINVELTDVAAIDEDRVLRLFRAVVQATLRTNAYAAAASEALAFKLDSAAVPGLPKPLPWREIWVYSPRVEGVHLRAGPIARGGLRWSDRRDDFRTEVLGLMKAQRVKNAVIVPTGAKGGFYPKRLPDPAADRDAWVKEGTESYRVFIRTLLSVTDNIVNGKIVHPAQVVVRDDDDPYFVVAADKGTATFSDTANAIAIERNFWLGDAFASGGSVGYDHKAMGITAKGGWISVQRHFAEMGVDVQNAPVTVAGVGDMSGDVFGNGMLLSKSIKLVAAFDHRHIFIDPSPDPAISWKERSRLFALPRSSWEDYNTKLISIGGGVFSRREKSIKISPEICALLGLDCSVLEPADVMRAILKSDVGLLWFGGIGTYIKDDGQSNSEVGDHGNDAIRINASQLRAKVIGEGANLGVTQAGRIGFAMRGGRINTDFIDNSAGVDCSDNEVNIKIALNTQMASGKLTGAVRVKLLASMTQAVSDLVLADNRLQTLALSVAEAGEASVLPAYVRLIETFEASGKLDRVVEGIASNEDLLRRGMDNRGMMRPELAVLLSTAKMAMQDAVEHAALADDAAMEPELLAAFPVALVKKHKEALLSHRLRKEIIATKIANKMINRLGMLLPFELAEEESCSLGNVAGAFVVADRLLGVDALWQAIDESVMTEDCRLMLFGEVATEMRAQMADIIRCAVPGRSIADTLSGYAPYIKELSKQRARLLPNDARMQTEAFGQRLLAHGAPEKIVTGIVRLAQLDGATGLAALASAQKQPIAEITMAFTALGDALGLGWAHGTAMQMDPKDPWERLLVAGLARDFQTMRLDFLRKQNAKKPADDAKLWLQKNGERVAAFKAMVDRARINSVPSAAMLAQIAGQARALLGR